MKRPYHLLLVEDDADDALLFSRRLPDTYQCTHVATASAALPALQERAVDAVFIDYRLGADDGLALVRQLRAHGIELPVVILTGLDVDALGENALLAGATDFIAKADLSPEAIARVTRWSMIRRLVEVQRRIERSKQEIRRFFAVHEVPVRQAAPAASADNPGQQWRRVLYASRASRSLSDQEFSNLCALSAANNQPLGMTGALVCVDDVYLQALEGPQDSIQALIERLARDDRHRDMVVIDDAPIRERDYIFWNMGSFRLSHRPLAGTKNWLEFASSARAIVGRLGSGRKAMAEVLELLASR